MKFLWFGKKKKSSAAIQEDVQTPELPTWSVNNFVLVESPLANSFKTDRAAAQITTYLAGLVTESAGPAELALLEFLQERGTTSCALKQFSQKSDGARSAKVSDSGATLLLGSPELIARATMPFASEITAAIEAGADQVFAIDALAYASFSLSSSAKN